MTTIAETLALAVQVHQRGDLHQARQLYLQVLQADPANADAHHMLGVVAYQLGRCDLAVTLIGHAISLNPSMAACHCNLGLARQGLGQMEEAVASLQEALRLEPDSVAAHNALGDTLRILGRVDEAELHCREALRLRPDFPEAHNNLGNAVTLQGKLDEALVHYEYALRLVPDFAKAHWNRAMLWLRFGDWDQGWPEYEWRWAQDGFTRREFPQPMWDGSDLKGRTILLHAEQGLGDTLHFIRYVNLVKSQAGRVILECQAPLLRLLAHFPGVDDLIARGSPLPPFDVHLPLLSLPRIFRTSLATIPGAIPYLHADARLAEHWRREMTMCDVRRATCDVKAPSFSHAPPPSPLTPFFHVGIAWQGSAANPDDRQRSIPVVHFERLAEIPGVRLISLQKGDGTEQLSSFNDRFALHEFGEQLDEVSGAFMDTAAIMKNLDLVICSDSAVAHLAGALGIPVWVALPLVPDWRWLLQREDTPWYPTMRLFRQNKFGDWSDVFQRIAAASFFEIRKHEKAKNGL
jgi:Flp pilus assembly protein TadD